jgi:hypothetical protein
MSLALLLEAVRFVEHNESGRIICNLAPKENFPLPGLLSSGVLSNDLPRSKRKENKRSSSYRSTHNQLEKNRLVHRLLNQTVPVSLCSQLTRGGAARVDSISVELLEFLFYSTRSDGSVFLSSWVFRGNSAGQGQCYSLRQK